MTPRGVSASVRTRGRPMARRSCSPATGSASGPLDVVDVATGEVRSLDKAVHGGLSWQRSRIAAVRSGARTPTQVVVYDRVADGRRRADVARGPVGGVRGARPSRTRRGDVARPTTAPPSTAGCIAPIGAVRHRRGSAAADRVDPRRADRTDAGGVEQPAAVLPRARLGGAVPGPPRLDRSRPRLHAGDGRTLGRPRHVATARRACGRPRRTAGATPRAWCRWAVPPAGSRCSTCSRITLTCARRASICSASPTCSTSTRRRTGSRRTTCTRSSARSPTTADRYRDRSPINVADRITSPLLILQGDADEVVPPGAVAGDRRPAPALGPHGRAALLRGRGPWLAPPGDDDRRARADRVVPAPACPTVVRDVPGSPP